MKACLIALQFLTSIPVRLSCPMNPAEQGQSLLFYPLIGGLIGCLLITPLWLVPDRGLLTAALMLTIWVLLTGALHLDGLADSVDAWVGGWGDRERILSIMKDPRCGSMGVMALILVSLLKLAALNAASPQAALWIGLTPIVGRTLPLAMLLTTPYVRPGGLGDVMARHLPHHVGWSVIVAVCLLVLALTGPIGLIPLLVVASALVLIRHLGMRLIGGCTGDILGALIEIGETLFLVTGVVRGEW